MEAIKQALAVTRLDPGAWLEYTEQNVKNRILYYPEETKYRGKYRFREVAEDQNTRKINKLVVQEIVSNTNHLMDYMRCSIKKNRVILDDCIEALNKHKNFLDKYKLSKDNAGYYRIY